MPETPLLHYLRLQRGLDRDVLSALRVSAASVESELRRLEGRVGVGAAVRSHQLTQSQAYINREMARFWGQAGNTIAEHQANAAAEAAEASLKSNPTLSRLFSQSDLDYMSRSTRASAAQGLETAMQRVSGASYVPLAESVYNNAALTSGKVDDIVTAALARGASAAELAKDVRGFINPNTLGGVRYASLRLGRTELNNAFHASQIQQAQKSPWVTAVMWNLSGSHPKPDECNEYADSTHFTGGEAGQFKPMEVPSKPHPNCLCYTTTVDVGRDEFIKQFESGQYDEFLEEEFPGLPTPEAPSVTAMPQALSGMEDHATLARDYTQWVEQHASNEQLEALNRYSGGNIYQKWNPNMRGQSSQWGALEEKDLQQIDALKSLISESPPLRSPVDVLRGVSDPDAVFGSDLMAPGSTFQDNAFISTTMNDAVRAQYAGLGEGASISVRVPKGVRAAVVNSEGQIVLAPGTEFRVVADRWVQTIRDQEGYDMLMAENLPADALKRQFEKYNIMSRHREIVVEVVA